jgi:hypothetical protein
MYSTVTHGCNGEQKQGPRIFHDTQPRLGSAINAGAVALCPAATSAAATAGAIQAGGGFDGGGDGGGFVTTGLQGVVLWMSMSSGLLMPLRSLPRVA